jgi:signal transduction histidine kinase
VDIGVLLQDRSMVHQAVRSYERDPDVSLIVVQDVQGNTLYVHRTGPLSERELFSGAPNEVHDLPGLLRSWAPLRVEGQDVGRLGLGISTERVRAGEALRSRVLWSALGVGVLAMLASFLFVRVYVAPLLDVTRRAFLDLEQRTLDALEATQAKSAFLANVSHELRTPLNGVLGMIGLLLRSDLSAPQRRQAEIVSNASKSLLLLINDLLDFSAVEAGQLRLHAGESDLRELLQTTVELLAVSARGKALDVACHVADDVPRKMCLDADRLKQILANIVGNAIKFTPAGEVEVSMTLEPPRLALVPSGRARLRVEVRDRSSSSCSAPSRRSTSPRRVASKARASASRSPNTSWS